MGNLLLDGIPKSAPTDIYLAKVTRFNISSDTVDVVSIDDNVAILNCQVLCSMPAGFLFGTKYVPSHNDSNLETGYVHSPGDIYCVATFLGEDYNNAIILGFLFPKETTLSIPDYGLFLFRHESDVMWMVRGDGTVQMYHPSGSIIKIGSDDGNEMSEDLMIPTKANSFNVRDANDYNSNKASNLIVSWYKGQQIKLDSTGNVEIKTTDVASGADKSVLTLTPTGDLTAQNETSSLNIAANGSITFTSSNTFAVNAAGQIVNITADQINFIKG